MPSAIADPKLKLLARDTDDLVIVSAQLQDAIVPMTDVTYLAAERLFVMAVNRFMWNAVPTGSDDADDTTPEGGPVFLRCSCGVRIRNVERVQLRRLDLHDSGRILELLHLYAEDGIVHLIFADGPDIRITVSELEISLEDFGEPWPTRRTPSHPLDAAAD